MIPIITFVTTNHGTAIIGSRAGWANPYFITAFILQKKVKESYEFKYIHIINFTDFLINIYIFNNIRKSISVLQIDIVIMHSFKSYGIFEEFDRSQGDPTGFGSNL